MVQRPLRPDLGKAWQLWVREAEVAIFHCTARDGFVGRSPMHNCIEGLPRSVDNQRKGIGVTTVALPLAKGKPAKLSSIYRLATL